MELTNSFSQVKLNAADGLILLDFLAKMFSFQDNQTSSVVLQLPDQLVKQKELLAVEITRQEMDQIVIVLELLLDQLTHPLLALQHLTLVFIPLTFKHGRLLRKMEQDYQIAIKYNKQLVVQQFLLLMVLLLRHQPVATSLQLQQQQEDPQRQQLVPLQLQALLRQPLQQPLQL